MDQVDEQLVEDLGVPAQRVAEARSLLDVALDVLEHRREDGVRLLIRQDVEALDERQPGVDHGGEEPGEGDQILGRDPGPEPEVEAAPALDLDRGQVLGTQAGVDGVLVLRLHLAPAHLARPGPRLPCILGHR